MARYGSKNMKEENTYPVKETGKTDKTGTLVTFKPDLSIFKDVEKYNYETLANRMRELSYLNKGINISLTDKRKKVDGEFVTESFHSEHGLKEFITFLDENREPLIPEVISIEGEKNNVPVEIAMVYNSSFNENIHSYVNNINTHEGGTHLSGFRRGLTSTFVSKYADSSGLLDKIKFEISGDDFERGTTAIISVKVAEPQFEGQTKTKLGNKEVSSAVCKQFQNATKLFGRAS